MSADKEHDPHHISPLVEVAKQISKDHGEELTKVVAVLFTANGYRVVGKFNNSDLGDAIEAILTLASEHVPDGCPNCDGVAAASMIAGDVFRRAFVQYLNMRGGARKH